ncbi:MAG TPA: ATP-binding cassette domain-containing protein [Candidatus Limnocylindria bacterium]|nr:ATP-binding cassette domain-containing protein [Candidatus Limnocylindria bacterium]
MVSGLERSVGRQRLLDGVNLRVPVGARLLLVSQPESAASLLLGILAGLARARRGRFELAGLSRADDPSGWRRRVAYLPPDGGFYPWLSPMEVLELAGRLAGYEREERARRIDAAVERYRLASGLRRPVSRGGPALAQKVGLAAAMIGDPEVLLLDEPLRALDDTERARLLRIPGRRRTVLLASRYPASEEGLVDQVALLRDGRLALHARRDELTDHGLPLSMKGIVALTELRAAAPPAAASA